MKYLAIAALVGAASASSEIEAAFLGYITQFGKSYSNMEEFEHRLANFKANHEYIFGHNSMPSSFKLGHNQFSDWTDAEYKAILTYKPEVRDEMLEMPRTGVAEPVDWRDEGAVNEVQDQGSCGSCWTFSTMASFEGAHYIATGNLEKYAEQQLVDCVRLCYGCNGGNVSIAFNYLKKHDAMYETEYRYTAKDGTCAYKGGSDVRVSQAYTVPKEDATAMKEAVSKQPVSVAIQADQKVFQTYKEGIFDSAECGTALDHATNVVGWGTELGQDYWIMRNSWGATWGESGYMRIAIRDGHGICGIQMQVDYADVN
jgi:C1A family cysteine protease